MPAEREDHDPGRPPAETETSPMARMQRAIRVIRREGYKVTVIYATVDAVFTLLVVNLLLDVVGPGRVPVTLPWPQTLRDVLVPYTGTLPPVPTSIIGGLVAGVVVFVAESVIRTRRSTIEQFESANPEVREALRTARDVARSGTESRIVVALYEDVLARLRRTSSFGLVNLKRVFVTVLLISMLSIANIHVAVVGLQVADLGTDSPEPESVSDARTTEYDGLQDASGVLGEPEAVTAGEETLNTTLSTQGGSDGDAANVSAYDSSGFSGVTDVEAQEAGFAEQERLDDAELIREYNLQIRSEDDDDV